MHATLRAARALLPPTLGLAMMPAAAATPGDHTGGFDASRNGEAAEAEVLAFPRVEHGRVVELNELTQAIRGDEADRAPGSRLR
jgi:hypothetical protein